MLAVVGMAGGYSAPCSGFSKSLPKSGSLIKLKALWKRFLL